MRGFIRSAFVASSCLGFVAAAFAQSGATSPQAAPSPAPATVSPACTPATTAVTSPGDGKVETARCAPARASPITPTTTPSAPAAAAAVDADQRTYTAGRIDGTEAVAAPTPGVSPVSTAKGITEKGIKRQAAAPVGSTCKTVDTKGSPIGGIVIKGGRCMAVTPPKAPGKGITEKGMK